MDRQGLKPNVTYFARLSAAVLEIWLRKSRTH